MPNQRSGDQIFTPVWMHVEFLKLLDLGCSRSDMNRSQFIRQAVKEKLAALGIVVADEVGSGPARAGKHARASRDRIDAAIKEAELTGAALIGAKVAASRLPRIPKAASPSDKTSAPTNRAPRVKNAPQSLPTPVLK